MTNHFLRVMETLGTLYLSVVYFSRGTLPQERERRALGDLETHRLTASKTRKPANRPPVLREALGAPRFGDHFGSVAGPPKRKPLSPRIKNLSTPASRKMSEAYTKGVGFSSDFPLKQTGCRGLHQRYMGVLFL